MQAFIERFTTAIRARAEDRRREGAEPQAQVYDRVATELRAEYLAYQQEALTVPDAAKECGFSEAQLYRLKRQLGVQVLRRCDLPSRPSRGVQPSAQTTGAVSRGVEAMTTHILQQRMRRGTR